jgi:hypothetical protein
LGRLVTNIYRTTTKLGVYYVSYADFPARVDDPASIKRVLDSSRDEVLANGAKLLNESDVTVEGVLGRELIVEQSGIIIRERTFFVAGRLYAVILGTTPEVAFTNGKPSSTPSDRNDLYETTCRRFFGSFKFIKNNGVTPEQRDGVLDPITAKTDLYPAGANAGKEIVEALKQATTDKKRVMLIFGANWCYDCHVLDRALHEGAAGKIVEKNFLLIHVDIGEGEKNLDLAKLYKTPLDKGVPAVAILDHQGKLLYSSGAGEFEAARRMMKKDLVAFLSKWIKK